MPVSQGGDFASKANDEGSNPSTGATLDVTCPACGSLQLAKVKGCIRCLHCHHKQDCDGF
jgi:hypothetical protein